MIPLALGGQPWQERILFNSVLLGRGRHASSISTSTATSDVDAVKSDEFRKVAETFGELRSLVDAGSPGPQLERRHRLVITGKAGDAGHGRLGQGRVHRRRPDRRQGVWLHIVGGAGRLLRWAATCSCSPRSTIAAQQAAQVKLAELMMSPETQIEFNKKKGSVPVRLDVDVSSMDVCAQKGMAALQRSRRGRSRATTS